MTPQRTTRELALMVGLYLFSLAWLGWLTVYFV